HTRLQGDWSSDVCSSDLPRLRQLNQRFDANQTSLVILEPDRSFLPIRHERIHALPEEHDVFAVFDDFAEQAHAAGSCAKSSAMRSEERRVGKACRARWGT